MMRLVWWAGVIMALGGLLARRDVRRLCARLGCDEALTGKVLAEFSFRALPPSQARAELLVHAPAGARAGASTRARARA